MNKAVRTERRKLSATFVNGIAIAFVAIGGVAQAAGLLDRGEVTAEIALFVVICVMFGALLHWIARASLGGMEE